MAITVMKRYELKYLLSGAQTDYLRQALTGRMEVDAFGLTSIASLYYDTPDRRLIRASLEKPEFKEKLRLRSYGLAAEDSPVYLELKRKYAGVVYKRRVQTTVPQAEAFLAGAGEIGPQGQIKKELAYFRDYYRTLEPACLIIYDRTAYFQPDGDLRLTVDYAPRYRTEGLSLTESILEVVDRYRIPHELIEIELTETVTDVEFRDLKRVAGALQEAGIYTSVDDFGIGYSSLNLIREIPWNILKVDKNFLPVNENAEGERQNIMFRHVVSMAKEIGLICVAEGVETIGQVNILRKCGCDIAQGFYYDKPLPVKEFEERLDKHFYTNT